MSMKTLLACMAIVVVSVYGQELIFEDGFETGDTSNWTVPFTCSRGDMNMAVPKNLTIVGLPNVLDSDVVTVTAGSEGTSMLASELKDWRNPTVVARLDSIFPDESYWEIDFGPVPVQQVKVLGLGNYSLLSGAQARVLTVESGSLPPVRSQTLPPTAIEADDNRDAALLSTFDEHPSVADGSTTGADNPGLSWWVRLSFGTPSSPPAVGSDYQCFPIYCTLDAAPSNIEDNIVVTAELWENGVQRTVLGSKVVRGGLILFPWDAGDLQTPDGSQVELRLEFTGSTEAVIGLDALSWEVMHQTDKDTTNSDTGWVTVPGAEIDPDFGNTSLDEIDELPKVFRKYLTSPVTVAKARIEIREDGLGYFDTFLHTPPRTPATFIDAGFAIVHPVYEFPYQFLDGGDLRVMHAFVGDEIAIDGSQHKVIQYRWRECELEFLAIPKSKADALFKRLNWGGADSPILVSLLPSTSADIGDLYTYLATVERLSGHRMSNFSRDGETSRDAQYQFVEKLG